jgi:hypothetical protein
MERQPRAADDYAAIRARMKELKRQSRAADDYAAIRARMEEIKCEHEQAAQNSKAERPDEERWRISDELRARRRFLPGGD